MKRPADRPWLLAALLAGLLLAPGCAIGNYAGDRLMDLTDIIDIKYGVAVGGGVKVEISNYIGAGVGAAALGYGREWYGRKSRETQGFAFLWLGAIGVDGGYGSPNPGGWSDETADVYFLFVNGTSFADFDLAPGGDAAIDFIEEPGQMRRDASETVEEEPPEFEPLPPCGYWRFGAEVLVPGIQFGIYFNLGEVFDFILGWTTYDLANDDDASFFDTYNIERPERDAESGV